MRRVFVTLLARLLLAAVPSAGASPVHGGTMSSPPWSRWEPMVTPVSPTAPWNTADGRFNAPHDWHTVDTELVDATIELCDGTASMVDADVAYWVESVERFCPWAATVVAVEPAILHGSF